MASQVTNYKCAACGGSLHYSGSSGKLECDYCGSSYEVAQIEAMMKEENEKAATAMNRDGGAWGTAGETSDWGGGAMKSYSCPSCGAELVCDETTAATCCPYCGNQTIVPGQFTGSLKPDFVIPFKMDKKQAKEALKNHYKGKKLLPKSFDSGNHIEDIQGVYVPFWLYDCKAVGEILYDASNSEKTRSGDTETITTMHYEAVRGGSLSFEKVPVDASSKMPDGHMDSIEPFNYGELKEFSMAYMPGFVADKYDEDVQKCSSRMQERVKKSFVDELDKTMADYDTYSKKKEDISIKKGNAHYAMLPVWLLATNWNDQNFLFAMNGQTGKLVGDLPVDKGKYWAYFGGITAALIVLMCVFNFLVLNPPMIGATFAVVCIGIPLIIALIVCSILKGQMKSVHEQKARNYITGRGLNLSVKQDKYLRTTKISRNIGGGNNNGNSNNIKKDSK